MGFTADGVHPVLRVELGRCVSNRRRQHRVEIARFSKPLFSLALNRTFNTIV